MKAFITSLLFGLSIAACTTTALPTEDNRWTRLFDGKTLEGWFLHHGDLPFEVRDGEIVGSTAVDVSTRYLATIEQYDDFILELEMNNAAGENSGVQFRSVIDAPFYKGLTGYQLEVDPSEREWTGGIYFEGIGTWQHPPIHNPKCTAAWRKDGWNRLRIETKGEKLRTFVNGEACAYLFDEYLRQGHIGLQVHAIGSNANAAGAQTRWRNIRILSEPLASDYTAGEANADSNSHLIDRLSPIEIANGWELVRNRVGDISQWNFEQIANPINAVVSDANVLNLNAKRGSSVAKIPMPEKSFHLIADFQIEAGTAGEILYPVTLTNNSGETKRCLASYRIFDDRSLETRLETDPNLMGSLTDKIAAKNLSETGRPKRILYDNAWRRLEIRVLNGTVEHWLNAVKVVEHHECEDLTRVDTSSITLKVDKGGLRLRTIKLRTY